MEETMKRNKPHNIEHFGDDIYRKAGLFSEKVQKKYKGVVCSTLLKRPEGDGMNVRLIVDDLNNVLTAQDIANMRMYASELGFEGSMSVDCDVVLASQFWELFNERDPSMIELVRDYYVIQDNGFLRPVQDLLVNGKIRPSKESVRVYFVKAERSMKTANDHVAKAVIDLYWAVVDTAHAAVMIAGITPPSPKDLAETVKKELVIRNLVHRRCADIIDSFYNAAKEIMHRQRFEVSGKEFDSYLADADFFLKEMGRFIKEYAG